MKLKRFATLLLLAYGVSATQAAGVLSAKVAFIDLAFSVSDLTPSDGVDPFFEILPDSQYWGSTSILRDVPHFSSSGNAPGFLTPLLWTRRLTGGTLTRAEITATNVETGVLGTVNGNYTVYSDVDVSSAANLALIRIAPGTRLTFSGLAHLFASATECADCYALTSLELDFGYLGEENSATKTLFTSLASPQQSFSAPLGVSYANTSTEDQFLGLSIRARAEISSAVPEPASVGLALGGGLLALGFAQRRRRQAGRA